VRAERVPTSLPVFDAELDDLPAEVRWREWMGRVEAAVFASADPVPREVLSRLVGRSCVLDDLIADIRAELKGRPYDLVPVAGGWQHRTRPRFAPAIRQANRPAVSGPKGDLTRLEMLVLAAIAYQQPVTRSALSLSLGREVSRDVLARLKQLGLVGAGPRTPVRGAPLTYVTTAGFLSAFNLASLQDLPEIDAAMSGELASADVDHHARDSLDGDVEADLPSVADAFAVDDQPDEPSDIW
jgi:segregation and condensation protein B